MALGPRGGFSLFIAVGVEPGVDAIYVLRVIGEAAVVSGYGPFVLDDVHDFRDGVCPCRLNRIRCMMRIEGI